MLLFDRGGQRTLNLPPRAQRLGGDFHGSGIHQHTDNGWTVPLDDPSSIVPGSGTIGDVIFLAPPCASAINNGVITRR